MKYKVEDKVRIKSIDWYNKNKTEEGCLVCGSSHINPEMICMLGKTVTISSVEGDHYRIKEYAWNWTDEMIEGLVEEETKPNIIEEAKTYWDSIKDAWICPDGYIFKDENGNIINATKIVLEKKKKEYPKTYEECCKIVKVGKEHTLEGEIIRINNYKIVLLESFQKLLICRDAYWKIAGEEMRLGKPWEPDWQDDTTHKFIIHTIKDKIHCGVSLVKNHLLAFPTEEMRDAFKENFDPDIEKCKEFL